MSPRPPFPPKADKSRMVIGIMLALVLLGGVASFMMSGGKVKRPAPPRQEIVTITLPPPPPPPPPPKVEPPPPEDVPPPEEEMVMQDPVAEDEPPPDDTPPDAPPSDDLSTGIAGNGPDMGLSSGGGGSGRIGGNGRKGGGSKWGYYAAKVQNSIAAALRRNPSTKSATFSMQVKVWADSSGRITRAQLVGTSGNAAVDQAIKNQVLAGLQLPEPPPDGMPMPINMRITARKAS